MIFFGLILVLIIIIGYVSLKRNIHSKNQVSIIDPTILLISLGSKNGCEEKMMEDSYIYSNNYHRVCQKKTNSIVELLNLVENDYDLIHFLIDLTEAGEIVDDFDNKLKLNDLISKVQMTKTSYLIFANTNKYLCYENGTKRIQISVNLVMTLNRNNFVHFFSDLFEKISSGKTMPDSWNEVVSKSNFNSKNIPKALYVAGANNIVLLGSEPDGAFYG